MRTVNLFTHEDAYDAVNEDNDNGVDVSIMKWRSIRDALAAIKSVVNSQCGLCMQYNQCCEDCSLHREGKSDGDDGDYECCRTFSEIVFSLDDCLEQVDDFVGVLINIKGEEDNDGEG